MRILMVGSSGFIGSALVADLKAKGHQVDILQRKPEGVIFWDPANGFLDPETIENYDALINLAGEGIQKGRWTARQKQLILESRVKATSLLCTTATKLQHPPKVIINASAVGFYGDRGDVLVDESSSCGKGFLSEVCQEWEAATLSAREKGIRVVNLRFGMVLSPSGGALRKILLPFKWGLGGSLGTGQQYVSWIAMDDLVEIVSFVLDHPELSGPVNVVSPKPVTNAELTKSLGKCLSRPTFMRMPELMVRLIFGEMGQELLLASNRAIPHKLDSAGYQFMFADIDSALNEMLKKG